MFAPLKTFIIYASADRELRVALEGQLRSLIDNRLIQLWSDKEIMPGDVWDAAIKAKLLEAELFLMLISADFFNSDYIREKEFVLALEKLERGEAIVIPIIGRDCDWEAYPDIQQLQVLPPGGLPVTDLDHWKTPDKAWAETTRAIRRRIEAMRAGNTVPQPLTEVKKAARLAYARPQNGQILQDLPYAPEMVFVEGGSFQMGSDIWNDEKPIHTVTLNSFWIGKYPVTFEEYSAYCEATGASTPDDVGWGREHRPVIQISWEEARGYTRWLSDKTGKPYRLLSEAEWEYAARGGHQSKGFTYAGSNDLKEVGWYAENSGKQSHPVGEKKSNELGVYDMSGNVWEWCEDTWHDNYEGGPADGSAWTAGGDQNDAVLRGGSWYAHDNSCRAANRVRNSRHLRDYDFGFRVARDVGG